MEFLELAVWFPKPWQMDLIWNGYLCLIYTDIDHITQRGTLIKDCEFIYLSQLDMFSQYTSRTKKKNKRTNNALIIKTAFIA